MILASFLTTLFYASTYPYINKYIITNVSENMIALNQIINCASIIIFGSLWNKFPQKLFKHYPKYCVLETILNITITLFVLLTDNIIGYYLLDTFIFSVVTRNIICGNIKLRARRYTTEEKRSEFDNNDNSAYAAATIIGSLIAMILHLSFPVMIVLATIGNCIDNTFYVFIYRKTIRKEK